MKNEITQKELKKVLDYDADTGKFTWLKSGKGRRKNLEAGCLDKVNGYKAIGINGKIYLAHRLVFLYMTGKFPPDDTDHINHIKTDNRFVNLRKVTHSENSRNRSMHSNNKSGFTGVSWNKSVSKWAANIKINGKYKYLGYFTDINDAIACRKRANVEFGYHANHG